MSNFVRLIKEICREQEISLTSFGGDWVFLLEKGGKRTFIHGYQFGLDLAASANAVCKDKSAASDVMDYEGIPHVPHVCIMSPVHPEYIAGDAGNYQVLSELLKRWGHLVCKDNQGTGGDLVFQATNQKELECAAAKIFATAPSMAVSPYRQIEEEIRCIMLEGEVVLAFRKLRPALLGDGVSSVGELLAKKLKEGPDFGKALLLGMPLQGNEDSARRQDISYVPKQDEPYVLSWKHNLGQGAKAQLLQEAELPREVVCLAKRTVETFGLHFVSVDVIRVEGHYEVLEINNGVMMENLAGFGPEAYALAKSVYTKAILQALHQGHATPQKVSTEET